MRTVNWFLPILGIFLSATYLYIGWFASPALSYKGAGAQEIMKWVSIPLTILTLFGFSRCYIVINKDLIKIALPEPKCFVKPLLIKKVDINYIRVMMVYGTERFYIRIHGMEREITMAPWQFFGKRKLREKLLELAKEVNSVHEEKFILIDE